MFCLSLNPEVSMESTRGWAEMSQAFSEGLMRVARAVYRFVIENRMGLAFLAGLAVVPSQIKSPKGNKASELTKLIQNNMVGKDLGEIEIFKNYKGLSGLIYYPKGVEKNVRGKCVLYHPPNGMTATDWLSSQLGGLDFFLPDLQSFEEDSVPYQLGQELQCPIILYDYRGTGLSENRLATYETVVQDGQEAFQYAVQEFDFVYSVGTSLGGGVSAKALDRHLRSSPQDAQKITFISHNSFSSMPRVILPSCPRLADFLGWLIGASMNAVGAVKNLAEKRVRILVLSQENDPVIPRGARLMDGVENGENGVQMFEDLIKAETLRLKGETVFHQVSFGDEHQYQKMFCGQNPLCKNWRGFYFLKEGQKVYLQEGELYEMGRGESLYVKAGQLYCVGNKHLTLTEVQRNQIAEFCKA